MAVVVMAAVVLPADGAAAQQAPVGLGTADNFAVLAGQGVTNTGPTTVNGDLGSSPNPAVTGAGLTVNGAIHRADAVAAQAQADTTVAYDDASGRTPVTSVATELGGQTLTSAVYNSSAGTFQITGTLTLDAEGDPNAVFVFQAASTLITASNSNVNLINGATACNVFWRVGSSATLGTNSSFRGTILAQTSITVTTGVTLDGRALARDGTVTLDSDTITRATCTTPQTTSTTISSSVNPSDSGQVVNEPSTSDGAGSSDSGSSTTATTPRRTRIPPASRGPGPGGSSTSLATTGATLDAVVVAGLLISLGTVVLLGARRGAGRRRRYDRFAQLQASPGETTPAS